MEEGFVQLGVFQGIFLREMNASQQRLAGKVVIITGGASGSGAITAQLFHKNGAKVIIADVQDDLGQVLAKKLGEDASYVRCNVSEDEEMSRLVDSTVSKYGKLDIMYNNGGIIKGPSSILDATRSDLETLIGVNLVGAFLGAKHAARVMIPRSQGCILFTPSGCPVSEGISAYSYGVSKCGILGLAKNLAAELGQFGIRVNCISPNGVVVVAVDADELKQSDDPICDGKGKVLKAEDVAGAALFVASDEANYVSGLNLVVDAAFNGQSMQQL